MANAREALSRRLNESATQRKLLDGLAKALDLDGTPQRIEVYDNSHISGTKAVGAMIVAGPEGMMKNAYRKFNIRGASESKKRNADKQTMPNGASDHQQEEFQSYSAGDDYGMMREVLTRRFSRALKEDPDRQQGQWPDLVLIDGGAGQLSAAESVFAELGIDDVAIVAVAKGRNVMLDVNVFSGRNVSRLPWSRVIRSNILFSACVMRRTGLPLAHTGPAG